MPTLTPNKRYYPKLSNIVTVDDLPEFLSFVEHGLDGLLEHIHYKNLQFSKSKNSDGAFYSIDIVSKKISIPLPFNMALVLNSDEDVNISSFPVSLQYQWGILAFLRSFDIQSFAFTPEAFYELGLQIFRISEDQVLAHTLNFFVQQATNATTKYQQLIDDINLVYSDAGLTLPAGLSLLKSRSWFYLPMPNTKGYQP